MITIKERGGLRKNILLLEGYAPAVRKEVAIVSLRKMRSAFMRSQARVPKLTGELKGSGEVFQTPSGAGFRYTAEHASRIEYDAKLKHPRGGQAFYGQSAFNEEKATIKQELEKAAVAALKKKS